MKQNAFHVGVVRMVLISKAGEKNALGTELLEKKPLG